MRADEYASIHGPTTGDRIQLGDTGLVIEVESDSQLTGDEFLMGFGKTGRDGLMAKAITGESDPHLGNSLDIGSAAVLLASLGATVVGTIIFANRLGMLLGWWG